MQQFLVLQELGYIRHCKENATIYYVLCSTGNAYDVISYHRLSRPRAPPMFSKSLRQWFLSIYVNYFKIILCTYVH